MVVFLQTLRDGSVRMFWTHLPQVKHEGIAQFLRRRGQYFFHKRGVCGPVRRCGIHGKLFAVFLRILHHIPAQCFDGCFFRGGIDGKVHIIHGECDAAIVLRIYGNLEYPHLLTLLKFLSQDDRFTYIASGSLLGVTLSQTTSIPMGSIRKVRMFPLDFEEFLYANGLNEFAISAVRKKFERLEALDGPTHNKMMDYFRKYLLVGGLPDAVNSYLENHNIQFVREIQQEIHDYYAADASKYDEERKLKIRRIYDLIPSNMENKKKRVVAQSIEDKKGKTFADYQDEFEYLISAGIALNVQAISNPVFPLVESTGKNLLKLYLNDVGILTGILYGNNIRAVLDDEASINLGSVYESAVASELIAHGYELFYYDNRHKGEVDFLIDDYATLSAVPIEVKSGKDYTIHSALNNFVKNEDYHIQKAFVVSNERTVSTKGKIIYIPIYYIMFFQHGLKDSEAMQF